MSLAQSVASRGGEWQYLLSLPTNTQRPTALKFDPYEELLWCGTQTGRVTSFSAQNQFNRFTAFRSSLTSPVSALEITQEAVFSLTDNTLHSNTRHGIGLSKFTSPSMVKMCSMYRMPETSVFFLGGEQEKILQYDCERQKELRTTKIKESSALIIRSNGGNIFTSDSSGTISVRTPKTLEMIQKITCHGDRICDFDVQGNKLITCGCSLRSKTSHGDPFVKVYDLRTFKALNPIALAFSPIYTRFIPSYCEKLITVSQGGQVRICDTLSTANAVPILVETSGAPIKTFDYSSSTQFMAFGLGDFTSNISILCDRDNAVINKSSYETEFAEQVMPLSQSFTIDDANTPLAAVPMPFPQDETLFSDWPTEFCEPVYRRLKPLRQHTDVKTVHFVQQAKNPLAGTKFRFFNIVPYIVENEEAKPVEVKIDKSNVIVPQMYRKFKRIARRGQEDIASILQLNATAHVPIESNPQTHSVLVNPIVQALNHIPAVRNLFYSHLCEEENCLTCQLRFLFTILNNLTPELLQPASSLNLMRAMIENGFFMSMDDVAKSSQISINCLLKAASKAGENLLPESPLSDWEKTVFQSSFVVNSRCIRCGNVSTTDVKVSSISLNYGNVEIQSTKSSFCALIEKAIHNGGQVDKECENCKTKTRMEENRRVQALPPVIIVDANPGSERYFPFWQWQLAAAERRPSYKKVDKECAIGERMKPEKKCRFADSCRNKLSCKFSHGVSDWETECSTYLEDTGGEWSHYVPKYFSVEVTGGIARVSNRSSETVETSTKGDTYLLVGMVALIGNGNGEKPGQWTHSVALLANGDDTYPWAVINELLVSRIHEDEAFHFDARWKLPAMFLYVKKNSMSPVMRVSEKRCPIPTSVFYSDANLTGNEEIARERRTLRIPEKGDIVGIDAEFITVTQNCDKNTGAYFAARVSCVDATGENVLIDDYVTLGAQDSVEDYLTTYSGIQKDDLDPLRSSKHLTTAKRNYMKIAALVERGVIFVGHALHNDFSVLNIFVPENQQRDTVKLFRPTSRMIALQFLSYHLLGKEIQKNGHDSVEDARFALYLYRKHEELKTSGKLDCELARLLQLDQTQNQKVSPKKSETPPEKRSPVPEI